LSVKTDAEVIREVSERIDLAIRANRTRESIIGVVLVLLILVGLGLMIYGAAIKHWELLVPGGVTQLSIVFPVRWLIKLRADNVRLQIIPQLLRLADTQEAKVLVFQLIKRLIRAGALSWANWPGWARPLWVMMEPCWWIPAVTDYGSTHGGDHGGLQTGYGPGVF
jgi:hypothetical protein